MDWETIVPNFVGGAITAGTAAALFFVARLMDRSTKAAERHKADGRRALNAIQKFSATAQEILNINQILGRQFQDAQSELAVSREPAEIVTRFVRPFRQVEKVTIEEVAFLFPKSAQLYQDIRIIQENQEFNLIRVAQFNEERKELEAYRMNVGFILDAEGVGPNLSRRVAYQRQYETRVDVLNALLSSLIESLEKDAKKVFPVAERLVAAAKEEFGDALVIRSIELLGPTKC